MKHLGQVESSDVGSVFREYLPGVSREMIAEAMAEEVCALCGPAYRPDPEASCHRAGTALAPPQTFAGQGQNCSPFERLANGLAVFYMQHNGTSNFIVWLDGDQESRISLLVNGIGSFDGSKAIGIASSGLHLLGIKADGDWTIRVEQP